MKQIIILLFIVIIPSYLIAQESKWLEISKTKEGHPILMNTEMMKNDDYGVLVWFKYKMTSFKTKGINYKNCIMKFLYCFDCKKNKIEIRATYAYSEKGTLISSYKRPEYENGIFFEDIVPETLSEILLSKACELFNN